MEDCQLKIKLFMADKIFVDTSFFKAVFDPKDDFHKQAAVVWEKLSGENSILITSNYILDEAFTLLKMRCGKVAVSKFRDDIAQSDRFRLIRALTSDEANAWNWFLNDWSDLSFTDCVSFAIMKRLNTKRVATFDNHFARAGFKLES